MPYRRKDNSGLSLIELLVVLGIIGAMSAVAIPIIVRGGLFSTNKVELAARDLFTMIRAAKIYATTYNIETAIAYGGNLVEDSRGPEGTLVPIVDSIAIVRKLTRKEVNILNVYQGINLNHDDPNFVALRSTEGGFRKLPNRTCILPDIFEARIQFGSLVISTKGLTKIRIFDPDLISDPDLKGFQEPRPDPRKPSPLDPPILDYEIDQDVLFGFPAHRFSPEGALLADDSFQKQRITIRVGMLPSEDIEDRFYFSEFDDSLVPVNLDGIPADLDPDPPLFLFSDFAPANPPAIVDTDLGELTIFHDPDRPNLNVFDSPIDNDIEIDLYLPTGRVQVRS